MSFTTFLLAATVLAITPGPGLAYVVARTVAGGRAEGLASCCGTALGGLLHVVAAALGLSLLIAQSAMAFNLLKYLGAAYLVYLGIRMLVRGQGVDAVTPAAALGSRRALLEGLVVEAPLWWQLYQRSMGALAPDSVVSRRHAGANIVDDSGKVIGRMTDDDTDFSLLRAPGARAQITTTTLTSTSTESPS